ncbi:hypothetical protein [Streptomyces sp. BA2]|uniref:hypothetical protein n=1 Tax=Streptomyces sp. BA2 TaxID=436595 RepID=UPI001323BE4F|nr:hypothetical protein [Streptomyces sp. BA2]MWA07902.1 hypothetical protein [Streptomyces sp. BA2]
MIEVGNLTKRYGGRLDLNNVSFGVPQGSVTAFLGLELVGLAAVGHQAAGRLSLGMSRRMGVVARRNRTEGGDGGEGVVRGEDDGGRDAVSYF